MGWTQYFVFYSSMQLWNKEWDELVCWNSKNHEVPYGTKWIICYGSKQYSSLWTTTYSEQGIYTTGGCCLCSGELIARTCTEWQWRAMWKVQQNQSHHQKLPWTSQVYLLWMERPHFWILSKKEGSCWDWIQSPFSSKGNQVSQHDKHESMPSFSFS